MRLVVAKLTPLVSLVALLTTGGLAPAPPAPGLVPRGQNAASADAEPMLVEGGRLERELPAGAAHSFRVTLTPGQFVKVVIEQAGDDLSCSVSGPDGTVLAEIDSRYHGPEPVSGHSH